MAVRQSTKETIRLSSSNDQRKFAFLFEERKWPMYLNRFVRKEHNRSSMIHYLVVLLFLEKVCLAMAGRIFFDWLSSTPIESLSVVPDD